LLCHPHLEETLREGLGKNMQIGVFRQIGGHPDNIRALSGQF
jgi:hypothetical protein